MIKRYDVWGNECVSEMHVWDTGSYLKEDEVKHLIHPPTHEMCPDCEKCSEGMAMGIGIHGCECGGFLIGCPYCGGDGKAVHDCKTCEGLGEIPVQYTLDEYRKWYIDNNLPDPGVWKTAVWLFDFGMWTLHEDSNKAMFYAGLRTIPKKLFVSTDAGKPTKDWI